MIIEKFSIHYNLDVEKTKYLCRKTSLLCKCGNFKRIQTSSQSKINISLSRTCGNKECEPNYGIKRPTHSLKMKELALNGSDVFKNNLIKKNQILNKNINSIQFKKKRLENKYKINLDLLSESEINQKYSDLLSKISTSRNYRIKIILNRLQTWEPLFVNIIKEKFGSEICLSFLNSLETNKINEMFLFTHGLNTFRYSNKIKKHRPSFFKKGLLKNFKYNQQESVFFKSGLELEYIEYFEKNSINWEYEPISLLTVRRTGFYIPDFIIQYNNRKIMLEVKGNFYRQNKEDYLLNKIQ